MKRLSFCPVVVGWLLLLSSGAAAAPSWDAAPQEQAVGQFWRLHWYERGLTNGNPAYEARFRINSPEVVLHPSYGKRIEARENGLMLIQAEEDLFQLSGAELYLEMWGGHPGTANKRFTVNGRSTYFLPRAGTEETNCTYFYPSVPLKISDLVNGYDAFQFALDQGTTFWGHALIDNACLRAALTNGHSDLVAAGLAGFDAQVAVETRSAAKSASRPSTRGPGDTSGEEQLVRLICPDAWTARIAQVDFQGWYMGYDENGQRQPAHWHGFSKARQLEAHLGHASMPPFPVEWDQSMLPAQRQVSVRALIRFKEPTDLVYMTPALTNLSIGERPHSRVRLLAPADLPHPFWSRANQKRSCTIDLDVDPGQIERAELNVVIWDGGAGTVKDYFTLNGVPLSIAGKGRHDVIYSRLKIDPALLRRGANRIELLSDTEHHGIEVLWPGPALIVREKTSL